MHFWDTRSITDFQVVLAGPIWCTCCQGDAEVAMMDMTTFREIVHDCPNAIDWNRKARPFHMRSDGGIDPNYLGSPHINKRPATIALRSEAKTAL